MCHDVLRVIFPGLPSDLRGTPSLIREGELIIAGLASSLKNCLIVTGGGCRVVTPVTCLPGRVRPQSSFLPIRQSPGQVYEELFHRKHLVS